MKRVWNLHSPTLLRRFQDWFGPRFQTVGLSSSTDAGANPQGSARSRLPALDGNPHYIQRMWFWRSNIGAPYCSLDSLAKWKRACADTTASTGGFFSAPRRSLTSQAG